MNCNINSFLSSLPTPKFLASGSSETYFHTRTWHSPGSWSVVIHWVQSYGNPRVHLWWKKWQWGKVSFEHLSFHPLNYHSTTSPTHLSSRAGTIDPPEATVTNDLVSLHCYKHFHTTDQQISRRQTESPDKFIPRDYTLCIHISIMMRNRDKESNCNEW